MREEYDKLNQTMRDSEMRNSKNTSKLGFPRTTIRNVDESDFQESTD